MNFQEDMPSNPVDSILSLFYGFPDFMAETRTGTYIEIFQTGVYHPESDLHDSPWGSEEAGEMPSQKTEHLTLS